MSVPLHARKLNVFKTRRSDYEIWINEAYEANFSKVEKVESISKSTSLLTEAAVAVLNGYCCCVSCWSNENWESSNFHKFENKNREKKSKVGKLFFFKIGKSHKWDYSAVPSEVLNEMSKILVSRAKVRK